MAIRKASLLVIVETEAVHLVPCLHIRGQGAGVTGAVDAIALEKIRKNAARMGLSKRKIFHLSQSGGMVPVNCNREPRFSSVAALCHANKVSPRGEFGPSCFPSPSHRASKCYVTFFSQEGPSGKFRRFLAPPNSTVSAANPIRVAHEVFQTRYPNSSPRTE